MIYSNVVACDPMIYARNGFSNVLPPPNTHTVIRSPLSPKAKFSQLQTNHIQVQYYFDHCVNASNRYILWFDPRNTIKILI